MRKVDERMKESRRNRERAVRREDGFDLSSVRGGKSLGEVFGQSRKEAVEMGKQLKGLESCSESLLFQ